MMTRILIIVVLALLTAGAAGCGSAPIVISSKVSEFKFEPATWTVKAGSKVAVSLTNSGAVEHEWVLLKSGEQAKAPWTEADESKIYFESEVEPGAGKVRSFIAPASGIYQIICGVPGHLEAGMQGTLIVK
ncbi:MAG: cupredoxin domain-containing protein [Chloroflexi bacterium]|nr:cupredoxin domain-containing protein [Chloroflexota bacterium]